MNESDSGEKDQDEDENEDHDMTRVPWNGLDNSQRVTGLKAYYLRNTQHSTLLKCSVMHAFCMTSKRINIIFKLNMRLLCFTKCANIFKLQIYVALLIFITGSRMKIVLLFGSICGPGIKSIIESESHGHSNIVIYSYSHIVI